MNGCSELWSPNSIPVGRDGTCGTMLIPSTASASASASLRCETGRVMRRLGQRST